MDFYSSIICSVHWTKAFSAVLRIGLSTLAAATAFPPDVNTDEVRDMINTLKSVQIIDPLFLFKNNKLSIQMGIWVALLLNN